MDLDKVKQVIELLDDAGLTEIEITEGESTIRVSRQGGAKLVAPALPTSGGETAATQPTPSASSIPATKGHVLRAPMVGMFYLAPSPGSPAFAEVGDRVKEGQVLCIIESMKMMNQVKCDKSGTLEAVLVQNETPVEFDQPLFTIV